MLDLQAYLNRLASAQPTPGGGSAGALVGAFGAALIAMVARITLGSSKFAPVHSDAVLIVESADRLRAQFVAARPIDEAAYAAVVAAQTLPRSNDDERGARSAALAAALAGAAAAPLQVATLAADLFALSERAAQLHNAHLMSDVACALAFARAALDAAVVNVRINHRFMHDRQLIAAQAQQLTALLNVADLLEARTQAIITAG